MRSKPGRLTLRRARKNHSPSPPHKSTSASIAASAGTWVFILAAAAPIALRKQADQGKMLAESPDLVRTAEKLGVSHVP